MTCLAKLDPECTNTTNKVSATHIEDELNFLGCVLIRVAVGSVGAVCQ